MPTRNRLLSLLIAALLLSTPLRAANLDGSTAEVGNAEAARLYQEADDYVSSMSEGGYSYAYLQFYWKRAQSNVDRVLKVYPDSPTAKALARGDLKLGPYPLDYFRQRVLFNLETKQLGAFEDVNCAIFLYSLDLKRSDAAKDMARSEILEVLARRQRWGEALRFPVPDDQRSQLLATIFRVAANDDRTDEVTRMMKVTPAADRAAAGFDAIMAESMAILGKPRSELYSFVEAHPTEAVRSAALEGIVTREVLIHRMERLKVAFGDMIQTTHFNASNVTIRDDVPSVARQLYAGNMDAASLGLAPYYAALGTAPASTAPVAAHLAYVQYLADSGRLDAAATYARDNNLSGAARRASDLKLITLYAEAGQKSESERARKAFGAPGTPDGDQAALADFRGRLSSKSDHFVARSGSFSDLQIKDPCVLAVAIMEWAMTPTRSQRGATPWDAVVLRYAGGFDNLPMPKSKAVRDAASSMKPY